MTPGTQLGPYRIEKSIGAGGMGEVFRATDTRLNRVVAIKILSPDKGAGPGRRRRFIQEARAASALNHPNIVTLHDIANDGGVEYLVMEFVEGQSLDKLITSKGLPIAEAAGYAMQIAGALAAAHAAGIVHRDIKPSNVMVTTEGVVKVLDFGLAKLSESQDGEDVETATGAIVGTPAYMSPEQAAVRPLDYRTDIFSLGVVLYEMLAGKRPFGGNSHVEAMHSVMHGALPPLDGVPHRLEDIVDKALAKDARDRYQSAADLAVDLRRFLKKSESSAVPSPPSAETGPVRESRRVRGVLVTGLLLALGVAAAWLVSRSTEPETGPLTNLQFKFTRLTDFAGDEISPALSPDGKFAVFISDRDGQQDIWWTQVGTGRFENLSRGGYSVIASTFMRDVGFTGDGSEIWLRGQPLPPQRFRLLPLLGGSPRPWLGNSVVNVAWSSDGKRIAYFTSDPGDPIFVADPDGTNAKQIYIDRPGMHNHFTVWSPDDRWIYFVNGSGATSPGDLWRIAPFGGSPERLTEFNRYIAYPTPIDENTVLYVAVDQDGSGPWLWALDLASRTSRRVTTGVETYTAIAAANGGRRLIASVANPIAGLWRVPIVEGSADQPAEESSVKLYSVPNTRALMPRLAEKSLFYLSSRDGGNGLWHLSNGQALEIWKGSAAALFEPPAVSRDGRQAAIVVRGGGKQTLRVVAADGSEGRTLAQTIDVRGAADWSPDGKWIVTGGDDGQGAGLFKIPVDGGSPVRLAKGGAHNPVWSPDGTLIAYVGLNIGGGEPVQMVRPDGAPVPVTSILLPPGGERLRFMPDSKRMVFMRGSFKGQDFWMLDLSTMKVRQLTHLNNPSLMRTFDVTSDGKEIVFDRIRENSDIVLIDLTK